MNISVFSVIYLAQVIVTFPNFRNTCERLNFERLSLYFIHHILDVFLFWSFLFLTTRKEYIVHLITMVVVALHWITNNNNCIATEYMNKLCGYNQNQWLDSLKNMFDLRKYSEYFLFIWLGLLGVHDIYHIL